MMARLLLSMCLAFSATPAFAEVFYVNSRELDIPARFESDRIAQIQHVLLFQSKDKGQSWNQVGKMSNKEKEFPFKAPIDGEYWFRVASVNMQNQQDPIDIAKAKETLVIVIDTYKPIVKLQAQREGSEVAVSWSIVEENPQWDKFRVEYQAKDGQGASWQTVLAQAGMTGQARFTPAKQGSLFVRVTVFDKADNVQYATTEVQGSQAAPPIAYVNPPREPARDLLPLPDPISVPVNVNDDKPLPIPPAPPAPPTPPPAPPLPTPAPLPTPPQVEPIIPVSQPQPAPYTPPQPAPYIPPQPAYTPPPQHQQPVRQLQASPIPGYPSNQPTSQPVTRAFAPHVPQAPPSNQAWTSAPAPQQPEAPLRTIATSEYTPQPAIIPVQDIPVIPPTPAKKLPTLVYVNTPEVILEYEVSQVGPSGVGVVRIYGSVDDGKKWVLFLDDPNVVGKTQSGTHKRRAPLTAGDGDYWFIMQIKSKAQLKQEEEQGEKGREPQPGDAPEMRVRLDTKAPVCELYAPRPDPTRPNTLQLLWAAQDENFGETPVTLEWSETKEGPWHPIGVNLPNTGRHSWAIPETLPVQVHMRLRVRDLADNESIAATQEPLIVDLKEARGRLKSIQPLPRIPSK